MQRILLAEDDQLIVEGLSELLANEGFVVDSSPTQAGAVELACRPGAGYALALVDLTLAEGNGFAVCNAIKTAAPDVPVIFLTAADDELNTVTGLSMGADDYVAKPFRPRELVARIHAAIRRWGGLPSTPTARTLSWTARRSRSPRSSTGCCSSLPRTRDGWSRAT